MCKHICYMLLVLIVCIHIAYYTQLVCIHMLLTNCANGAQSYGNAKCVHTFVIC